LVALSVSSWRLQHFQTGDEQIQGELSEVVNSTNVVRILIQPGETVQGFAAQEKEVLLGVTSPAKWQHPGDTELDQ